MGGAAGLISGGSGGGLSSSSSASSAAGDSSGQSGSGNKQFNFGANPNTAIATQQITSLLANPFIIGGAVLIVWLVTKKGRRK